MLELERRLAAILAADIAGYSRLMADDEQITVRTLTSYREQVGLLVRQHRGRLADFTGDNFLAEFPSAVSAVQCAVEIQRVLQARNADTPHDRKMQFRMGVHLGDVVAEQERIFGDGVNIAARLQALAEPGGICISAAVREQVHNKLAVSWQDLGEQSLKNIPEPVRVYRTTGDQPEAVPEARRPDARRPLRSLAVLPLENLSGDPEQEYFADGMTESLIGDLGKLAALRVISRTSVMQYKRARKALPAIARELNVDAIVEGTVTRAGDRVRITAQLIDGRSDEHVWADRYERPLRDVLDVQSDVAHAIARAIQLEISPSERARLASRRSVDPPAHDALLKGTHHFHRSFTPESKLRAIQFFERAIELDPDYALAHAWLGIAWWAADAPIGPPLEVVPKAKAAGLRALELDETLGEAHALLGWVAIGFDSDWTAGERHFRRALELNASFPLAHDGLAFLLSSRDRHEEAIAEERRAVELAPLELIWRCTLAGRYWAARRYDEALAQAREVLDVDPSFRQAHISQGWIYLALTRYAESIDALERAGLFGSQEASALRSALSREGARGVLREWIRVLRSRRSMYALHLPLAVLHAALGERDEAFAELERAFAARDYQLGLSRVAWWFDPIRDDPRFHALVRRIGIPES